MQLSNKSAFSKENALFIRKNNNWKLKTLKKIKKSDILLIVKEKLFHDKKCRSFTFFKTKCTISTLKLISIYGNLFVKIDIYN